MAKVIPKRPPRIGAIYDLIEKSAFNCANYEIHSNRSSPNLRNDNFFSTIFKTQKNTVLRKHDVC